MLYAGLFGGSALILFGVIYWVAGDALREQLRMTVQREVAALTSIYRPGSPGQTINAIEQRLVSKLNSATHYLLLDSNAHRLAGNLPAALSREGWQELTVPIRSDGDGDIDLDESDEHKLIALGARLPDGAFLLVGEDEHRVVEAEEAIMRAFGWAFGVTSMLAALGGLVLSFGFLRRVDAINRTSRAIIEGNLADRVPTRGTGDELDRLAFNLNEMLDRVQALMESLRQVSSDIAHDLRTPLSRLRQRLEAIRLRARTAEDYQVAVDQAISDVDSLLAIFAALLRISQIEAGTRRAEFKRVDLSRVFHSIADTYVAVAEDSGRVLSAHIAPSISIYGDHELLTQMLANLIENSIRHTPKGTRIELRLEMAATGPKGLIIDNGPGIPVEARARVFQRFFRLEHSRTTAGSGLGLSLVAAVADLHGIAVTLTDNEPGLRVELDFAPASRGDRQHTNGNTLFSQPRRADTRFSL